jgi:hypothetical protein
MNASVGSLIPHDAGNNSAKRREETEWMLDAIVGAIVAGKLPPDDACAWAKIAAYEVEMVHQVALPLPAQ